MGKTAALWGYSSAGRAPALQAGCQGFEPPYLHHRISEAAQRPLLLCIEVRGPEPRESEGVKQTRQWRVCSPNTRRTAEPAGGSGFVQRIRADPPYLHPQPPAPSQAQYRCWLLFQAENHAVGCCLDAKQQPTAAKSAENSNQSEGLRGGSQPAGADARSGFFCANLGGGGAAGIVSRMMKTFC